MDENRMQTIKLLRLNPIPRGANFMCWDSFRMGPSYMYAHQLLYIVDGTGTGRIGDDEYRLEPGVFSTYGPGVQYDFRSDPGVPLTAATMCFSWSEVSEKQLSVRNRSAADMGGDYLEYAESPVRIEGLPPFPFHLKIEPPQRGRMEELFREIGTAWRRTPGEPLLILRAKAVLVELVYLLRKQLDSPNLPAEPAARRRRRHQRKPSDRAPDPPLRQQLFRIPEPGPAEGRRRTPPLQHPERQRGGAFDRIPEQQLLRRPLPGAVRRLSGQGPQRRLKRQRGSVVRGTVSAVSTVQRSSRSRSRATASAQAGSSIRLQSTPGSFSRS